MKIKKKPILKLLETEVDQSNVHRRGIIILIIKQTKFFHVARKNI